MDIRNSHLLKFLIGFVAGSLLANFAPLSSIVTSHDYLIPQADSENGCMETNVKQVLAIYHFTFWVCCKCSVNVRYIPNLYFLVEQRRLALRDLHDDRCIG